MNPLLPLASTRITDVRDLIVTGDLLRMTDRNVDMVSPVV
jgi:hypothetical protein